MEWSQNNEMKWGWKGIWGWYCCRRCLEEGRWVDWNWGSWVKGVKGMRNNEEGVGRGNETRFLRLVKVVWLSDFNEFDWRSIVMWNGNEDKKGLKEVFEKGEVIEGIRVNGGQFVGIQPTWEIECWCVDVEWWLSVISRVVRLLSPLNTPEGREVSLLEFKSQMEDSWRKEVGGLNGRNR